MINANPLIWRILCTHARSEISSPTWSAASEKSNSCRRWSVPICVIPSFLPGTYWFGLENGVQSTSQVSSAASVFAFLVSSSADGFASASFVSSNSLIAPGVQPPRRDLVHWPIKNPNTFFSPLWYWATASVLSARIFPITSSAFLVSFTISIPDSSAIVFASFPVSIIWRRIFFASFFDTCSVSDIFTSSANSAAEKGSAVIETSPRFTRRSNSTIIKFAMLFGAL